MLVATRPLVVNTRYGQVRCTPGVTHIAEDHEVARRFPSAFKTAPSRHSRAREVEYVAGAARAATATGAPPARPSGDEPWRLLTGTGRCSVTRQWSTVGVRLSQAARLRIEAIVAETSERDGLEIGGLLLGRSTDSFLDVLEASGPGPRAIRRRAEFRADRQYDRQRIDAARERGYVPLGGFHTHPSGSTVPSPADIDVANVFREMSNASSYLEVIVSRDGHGWRMNGWITVPQITGTDRCSPVRL